MEERVKQVREAAGASIRAGEAARSSSSSGGAVCPSLPLQPTPSALYSAGLPCD